MGRARQTQADVIMISGCKDEQMPTDEGKADPSGAMTSALTHVLSDHSDISCRGLLPRMRKYLSANGFCQVPQMSSEQFITLDSSFVSYEDRSGLNGEKETVKTTKNSTKHKKAKTKYENPRETNNNLIFLCFLQGFHRLGVFTV